MVVWGPADLARLKVSGVLSQSPVPMPAAYRRECARVDETIEAIERIRSQRPGFISVALCPLDQFFAYTPADEYRSIIVPCSLSGYD